MLHGIRKRALAVSIFLRNQLLKSAEFLRMSSLFVPSISNKVAVLEWTY